VGKWNNDEDRYEITDHIAQFEMINRTQPTNTATDEQFDQHMQRVISSGAAFTFV